MFTCKCTQMVISRLQITVTLLCFILSSLYMCSSDLSLGKQKILELFHGEKQCEKNKKYTVIMNMY